jgi:hypothetical protein
MKYLVIMLGFLLFNGCAYQSRNLMNVKAEKFAYGLISCTNCDFTIERTMNTNPQQQTGGNYEKFNAVGNSVFGD